MGLRQRVWTAADCLYAPVKWYVSWSSACDRIGDGSFRGASVDRLAAAPPRGSRDCSASENPGSIGFLTRGGLIHKCYRAGVQHRTKSSEGPNWRGEPLCRNADTPSWWVNSAAPIYCFLWPISAGLVGRPNACIAGERSNT